MSKVDAMRAIREARYVRTAAPAGTAASGGAASGGAASGGAGAVPGGDLCGHRNMGGKHCSRLAGHREQNHRYATPATS